MKKYSVKEVRDITGLTRKQLFDFKEGIPGIGKNDSGYKQYSKEDVEKLVQAALFTKLGAKPKKINEIFKKENYDRKKTLKDLRNDAEKQLKEAEDIITIMEIIEDMPNEFIQLNPYICKDIHIFAEYIRSMKKDEEIDAIEKFIKADCGKKLLAEIGKLKDLKEEDIGKSKSYDLVRMFKNFGEQEIGIDGNRFLKIIQGNLKAVDDFRKHIEKIFGKGKADIFADAIDVYLYDGFDKYFDDNLEELLDCIGRDYDDEYVKKIIINFKVSYMKLFGLKTTYELISCLENIRYLLKTDENLSEKKIKYWDDGISYVIKGIRYYE